MANLGTLTLDLVAKIGQYVEPLNAAERKTKDASSSMVKQVDAVTAAMQRQQTETEKTAQMLGFFASSAKALAGGITVSTMVGMADSYGQVAAQIEIATKVTDDAAKSAEKYNYVQERLLNTANTTYRPLKEAQQVWLDVGGALEKVGYTTEQTLNITDSMSFAFTANATAADKATSATNAVTNSIVKNKVEADSWSSIMAAIPTITTDLAKQTGKTEQEILKLGASGKLSAKDLAVAFEVSRDKNEELANSMRNSVQDGFTRLVNAATVYIGKLNESTEATNTFAALLSGMGENIEVIANAGIVSAIGFATVAVRAKTVALKENIVTALEDRAANIAQAQSEQLAAEITAQRTARILHLTEAELVNARAQAARLSGMQKLAFVESTLIPLQQAHAKAIAADTVAQEANNKSRLTGAAVGRGLIGVLTGPVGLGVSVAAIAAGYLMMKNDTDKATESFNEHGKSAEEVIKKYNELSEAQRRAFKYSETTKLNDLAEAFEIATDRVRDYAVGVAEMTAQDKETQDQIKEWIQIFDNQGMSSEELANKINSLTTVFGKNKVEVDNLAVAATKAKDAMAKQQKVVETLTDKEAKIKIAHDITTAAVKSQAAAYRDLSDSQQKVIDKINQDAWRTAYIRTQVAAGWSPEKAAHFADLGVSGGYYEQKQTDDLTTQDAALIRRALHIASGGIFGVNGMAASTAAAIGYQVKSGPSNPADQLKLDDFSKKKFEEDYRSKFYNFSDSDRKRMAGALAYVTKHSLEDLAKANGLPPNLLAGLIAAESGGKDLTSPTGARGPWQTTSIFRKEYADILKKGNYSDQAYAMAAITHLKKGYKEFGNWGDALMSYNGGIEGTKALKAGRISSKVKRVDGSQVINGLRYQSPAKAAEMLNYPALRFATGIGGSNRVDESLTMPTTEDILKLQNDAVTAKQSSDDAKRAMMIQLAPSPLKQMELENEDVIKSIQQTFADQPEKLKEMLDRNNIIYQENRQKLILETQAEYDQYFEFEKDRITQITESYDFQKSLIGTNSQLGVKERVEAANALERQKQAEIEAVKLEEKQQILQAQELYMTETEIVMKRYQLEREEIAKNTQLTKETREALLKTYDLSIGSQMDRNDQKVDDIHYQSLEYLYRKKQPDRAAWTDLQGQYNSDQGGLDQAYSEQRAGIFLGIEDEEERNAKLLAAHEEYLQAKQALNDKYDEEEKDLRQAQLESQLASAESGFGSMTEMLRKSGEERSGIYRAMLVMEKSAAIARSIMAIQTGIAEASANPFPYNIAAMASVAAATANIVSSIQAVSAGFYDGGYTGDGGKYVAAGIVHKGEVVWSQDDIARWGGVANVEAMRLGRSLGGYSDGGIVGSSSTRSFPNIDFTAQQPQIVINTPPGMSARTEQRDGKTFVTIEEVQQMVEQSWQNLSRPSSKESKAVRQYTTARPAR